MELVLGDDLADHWHFKLEEQAEEGLFLSGRDDLADNGKIDRCEQEVLAVAYVDCFADVDALLPLKEDDQAGLISG
jgi:hypothetical protein